MRSFLNPNLPTKYKKVVTGLITRISPGNGGTEILINQRNDPIVPLTHGGWDFVGGGKNRGETYEETIKREAREEANLKIEIAGGMAPFAVRVLWPREDFNMPCDVVCFPARRISGELNEIDPKVKNLKFVRLEELSQYDFLITIRHFLAHFGYAQHLSATKRTIPLNYLVPSTNYRSVLIGDTPLEPGVIHPVETTRRLIEEGIFH